LSSIILQRSAVILAGGYSRRLGRDKGLVVLAGKPLVVHVTDQVSRVVDEIVVVVSSESQKKNLEAFMEKKAKIVVDKTKSQSPLVGAMTGFGSVQGTYSLLLPCDTPLISVKIIQFLLDICTNRNAIIPRWPSGYIEPLQAVYHTRSALTAGEKALKQGKLDLRSMIACLRGVRYVSTVVLRQMDTKLLTFFNINTPKDLKRAESLLK